ncbi:MAG: tRNA 2-selenouridine(34) synthase MnmH [Burkholderiales bacterium]|jgi:tRNA 2-selenouridine synthase|nr:tRNA 2-selenouridine(34) synthase MnmH [Burkholderiales bacterium]
MSYPSYDFRCTLSQRNDFDEIIDVRTPKEFAEDHIPEARNHPVLSNEERHEIGLLYSQSPFAARRLGAALVAKNIAATIENHLLDRSKSWKPLVYCWRGGMRSHSMVVWMRLIGWRASQLVGGHKTWRNHVLAGLDTLPTCFQWRIVCGATGSGKTRLLAVLTAQGEQTLDLEALAMHKGSVLGDIPNTPQPSQKWFETQLYKKLASFAPSRPVYVESESRKIGLCALPNALVEAMRRAPCIEIAATQGARLRYLLEDYHYLGDDPQNLCAQLYRLKGYIDNATFARWQELARVGDLPNLFSELIIRHYDPHYARSQYKHFLGLPHARRFETDDLSNETLKTIAKSLMLD